MARPKSTDRGEQLELPAELTAPFLDFTFPTFFERPEENDDVSQERS